MGLLLHVTVDILTEEQKKEELEKLYSAIGYSENEVITAFPKEVTAYSFNNGNKTEWCSIRSVIIRVTTFAVVRFVNHEYDYSPNRTPLSLITKKVLNKAIYSLV